VACVGAAVHGGNEQLRRRDCGSAKPKVEIELVNWLRAFYPDVVDRGVPPDTDPGRVITRKRRIRREHRLGAHDVGVQELRIIVELGRQIEPLETAAVAVPGQSDKHHNSFCGLGWIGLQLLDQRMLRQLWIAASVTRLCHLFPPHGFVVFQFSPFFSHFHETIATIQRQKKEFRVRSLSV
jgi:hypothetical protein